MSNLWARVLSMLRIATTGLSNNCLSHLPPAFLEVFDNVGCKVYHLSSSDPASAVGWLTSARALAATSAKTQVTAVATALRKSLSVWVADERIVFEDDEYNKWVGNHDYYIEQF
jgi:hypothetical protein